MCWNASRRSGAHWDCCTWSCRQAKFVSVAQSLWTKVVEPGSTAPLYRIHLYHPDILAAPHLRLTANAPCELRVDGATLLASDGRTPVVQPLPPLSRIARIEVVPANDAQSFRFELASTPLGGGRFLDQLPAFLVGTDHVVDWPRAEIGDGRIRAVVTLPDPVKGYYRGPRFEAAGMVVSLQGGGHEFASGNFDEGERDPVANDRVSGKEFGDEAGFDEARPGEPFLKVGVGLFEKPFAAKYSFAGRYWPLEIFPWEHWPGKTAWISASASLRSRAGGMTTGSGSTDARILRNDHRTCPVQHRFPAFGHDALQSSFLPRGSKSTGPAYTVEYGFEPVVLNPFVKPLLEVGTPHPSAGRHQDVHGPGRLSRCGLQLVPDPLSAHGHEHHHPGERRTFPAGLWLAQGLCPESFARIDLAPGEQKEWTRTYKLEQDRERKQPHLLQSAAAGKLSAWPRLPGGRLCGPSFREMADPTVIFHQGRWYLFPSAGMLWHSDDLVRWTHHPIEPFDPGYAPTVVAHQGWLYLTASWDGSALWRARDPLGPWERRRCGPRQGWE